MFIKDEIKLRTNFLREETQLGLLRSRASEQVNKSMTSFVQRLPGFSLGVAINDLSISVGNF